MENPILPADLTEDLEAITESLASVVIARQMSAKTVLTGMQAFLMALHASGNADAREVSEELLRMASYYRSLETAVA
jgi:hypothetical protein